MLQDKINMIEMITAKAQKEAKEFDELLLDYVDQEIEKKFRKIG